MSIYDFKYDDSDIVSDAIVNFYKKVDNKDNDKLNKIIDLYINDKKFFKFVQKNFLIRKLSVDYLIRLFNDYDDTSIIDDYDMITSVNTTRWI